MKSIWFSVFSPCSKKIIVQLVLHPENLKFTQLWKTGHGKMVHGTLEICRMPKNATQRMCSAMCSGKMKRKVQTHRSIICLNEDWNQMCVIVLVFIILKDNPSRLESWAWLSYSLWEVNLWRCIYLYASQRSSTTKALSGFVYSISIRSPSLLAEQLWLDCPDCDVISLFGLCHAWILIIWLSFIFLASHKEFWHFLPFGTWNLLNLDIRAFRMGICPKSIQLHRIPTEFTLAFCYPTRPFSSLCLVAQRSGGLCGARAKA